MYLQSRDTRSTARQKSRQSGEKQAGRIQREKEKRTRHHRPYDVGRELCYRGNRVIVMSQDFNVMPDRELAMQVFGYLWQGVNAWEYKWQRRNAFERFGKWVLAVHGDTRLSN